MTAEVQSMGRRVRAVRSAGAPGWIATAISWLLVTAFYSGLIYFRQAGSRLNSGIDVRNPVHPRPFYAAFLLFAIYAAINPNKYFIQRGIPKHLFWSLALFAIYMTFQMLFFPNSDLYWFSYRLEFMIMTATFIAILASTPNLARVLWLLRIVVLAESAFFVFVFLEPRALPAMVAFGRVSGFFLNPNVASLFIAGSVPIIALTARSWERVLVYALTFAGTAATLSRGGLVLWGIMFLLSVIFPPRGPAAQRTNQIVSAVALGGALMFALAAPAIDLIGQAAKLSSTPVARLAARQDFSVNQRAYVARLGMEKFLEHPILGNGVGYTMHWGYEVSTHNMFVLVLAEHGLVGLVLLGYFMFGLASLGYPAGLWALGLFVGAGQMTHNYFQAEYGVQIALYCAAAFLIRESWAASGDGGQTRSRWGATVARPAPATRRTSARTGG